MICMTQPPILITPRTESRNQEAQKPLRKQLRKNPHPTERGPAKSCARKGVRTGFLLGRCNKRLASSSGRAIHRGVLGRRCDTRNPMRESTKRPRQTTNGNDTLRKFFSVRDRGECLPPLQTGGRTPLIARRRKDKRGSGGGGGGWCHHHTTTVSCRNDNNVSAGPTRDCHTDNSACGGGGS